MKIAFDEHVPARLADVFIELAKDKHVLMHDFVHASRFVRRTDKGNDVPWMKRFASDDGRIVITGDIGIRSKPHERQAFLDCGLIVIMMPPMWNHMSMTKKCGFLLAWWDRLEPEFPDLARPSCWEIPAAWTGGKLKDKTGPLASPKD